MWNGTARQATDGNIIWLMCIGCWITKAADTHSEYIILIAFGGQQLLCKCTSILHYTSLILFMINSLF